MCSISGGISATGIYQHLHELFDIAKQAEDRGRDSWGIVIRSIQLEDDIQILKGKGRLSNTFDENDVANIDSFTWMISNNRAEPTTEYVKDKIDDNIQPFIYKDWVVAHNGIIANDKDLIEQYQLEPLSNIDSAVIPCLLDKLLTSQMWCWKDVADLLYQKLVGSYSLVIGNITIPNELILICNYKPLYIGRHNYDYGEYVSFASLPEYICPDWGTMAYLESDTTITQLPPYSAAILKANTDMKYVTVNSFSLIEKPNNKEKALVVCSGGLDSVTVATKAIRDGYEVTLLHFLYKCRAESKEKQAIINISERLGCDYVFIDTDIFKNTIGGSRLTSTIQEDIADGVSGAEFAHEWVPARNLIMLSIATGYAESKGYDVILLGNNLEESGCVDGDTLVTYYRGNDVSNPRAIPIRELYRKLEEGRLNVNGVRNKFLPNLDTFIKTQLPNGEVSYSLLDKAFYNGIKPMYKMVLEDGKEVISTGEHEWFTGEGYCRTDKLSVGETVFVNGVRYENMTEVEYNAWKRKLSESKKGDRNPNRRRANADRISISCNLKFASERLDEDGSISVGGMGFHPNCRTTKRMLKHRLIIEANMNNMTYEDWVYRCRTNSFTGEEVFLDPYCDVHHKDNNHSNNDISNLEVRAKSEHTQLYTGVLGHLVNIESIEPCGDRESYDLSICGTGCYFANDILGHNSYPDNEMIFIQKFSEVLPYAVAADKHVRIEMPVGNLMKWEIVKLGLEVDAPLDLCWSCYDAGDIHCGDCGPCFMRRTAFDINGIPDVIPYAK